MVGGRLKVEWLGDLLDRMCNQLFPTDEICCGIMVQKITYNHTCLSTRGEGHHLHPCPHPSKTVSLTSTYVSVPDTSPVAIDVQDPVGSGLGKRGHGILLES